MSEKRQWHHNLLTWCHHQFFFDVAAFFLSSLIAGPSFMSIWRLVLELWQFQSIKDLPEIWKSEIPPSEFCSISGDWGELVIPNFARMSLIKCYWVLQSARENQQGGIVKLPPIQIRSKTVNFWFDFISSLVSSTCNFP